MKRTSEEFWNWYHDECLKLEGSYEVRAEAMKKMLSDYYHEMEVGDRAHVMMWSDIYPVTILRKTATTLTVRRDKATLDPNWKPDWIIGGFSAHCTNNEDQEWIIEEDPDGEIEVFRWSKRLNCFKDKSDCKLLPGWKKFHDYNF